MKSNKADGSGREVLGGPASCPATWGRTGPTAQAKNMWGCAAAGREEGTENEFAEAEGAQAIKLKQIKPLEE